MRRDLEIAATTPRGEVGDVFTGETVVVERIPERSQDSADDDRLEGILEVERDGETGTVSFAPHLVTKTHGAPLR